MYIFLAYQDEHQLEAMSSAARHLFEEACQASEQELIQSGHLFAREEPQKDSTALAIQILKGRLSFTDSPFVPANGLSVRLFLVRARDLNAAIQIAARMPQARQGLIEVRPIVEFEPGDGSP